MRTTLNLPFLLLALVGCAAQDVAAGGDDDVAETDLAGAKADGAARPLGDFVGTEGVRVGDITTLTLAADKTFERRIQYVDCIPAAACSPEKGTYKLTRSTTNSTRFIRFYDADGTFMERYAYTYDGTTLRLRHDDESRWFTLGPADCRTEGCAAGTTCQVCWARFACVPDGALC